ncbi:hypothetical protein ACX1HT_21045 [Yersinia enterocolitica]|nr:hypothetical protein [Yersinia enterocolitica]HEI6739509.1 hypothetical protein [Yersinia enterocolitica]
MNERKEYCEGCGYAGTIRYVKIQKAQPKLIMPREMIDMAGDIASYAIKKASESGKAISGRDMENIIALVGILLPDS